MQIVIDLDTRKPQRSLTDSRTATQFDFKRGDDAVLEILFVRAGVQTQLTVGIALTFGVKLRGRYDSTPLVQTNDFTLSGSGATAKYIGYPSFNTEELNEAFGIDDSETNDVAVLDLMGEISWTEPTTEILTSSETFSVRVNNDVNREDDAPPNALPSPSDWLDARAVRFDKSQTLTDAQKQIARGNTDSMPEPILRDTAPVNSTMSVSGTLTDGTSPVTFLPMSYADYVDGKPYYGLTSAEILWNSSTSRFELTSEAGVGAFWTSTADVATPALVPTGAWHATTNPHAWKPVSPATGTPVVTDVGTAAQAVGQLVRVGEPGGGMTWYRVYSLTPNIFFSTTPTIAEIPGLTAALVAKQPLDSDLTAYANALNSAARRALIGAETAGAAALAQAAAIAASQPLDSDLTAYANAADAAARRALLALAPDTTGNTNLNAILAAGPAASRTAIDAARLSAANSFGGLQKLAIPGPFATDAEANTFGVPDDNLYYRSDGTVRAASHISLDLAFALDKTLTARTGPTPTFSRASSGLFVNADGILVGKTTGTTASLDPTTTTVGTTEVTVTVASGSVVGWLVGQSISLIVDSNANNAPDTGELWLVGDIVSMTATQLVFKVTSKGTTSASATDWTLGYRGARFDHDPATGVCKGLLIEESRTNLSLYSGAILSGIGWNTAETISTASGAGPDGNTAYNVSETEVSFAHSFINTGSTTAANTTSTVTGSVYTASIFLKKVTGSVDWVQLTLGSGGFGLSQYANFNLSTGNYGSFTGLAAGTFPRIEQFPNGWYRCSISVVATATTATSAGAVVAFTNNTNTTTRLLTYLGSASNSVLASMCQLEAGAFPTSYIPTTSGTAARSADVCSIIGADFSSFYNQSEGTLFYSPSIANLTGVNRGIVQIDNGLNAHMIRNYYDSGFKIEVSANDTKSVLINVAGASNVAQKLAISQQGTLFNAVANGGTVSTVTRTAPVGLNALRIGSLVGGPFYLNGHIARIQYFRKRLSNAKLQTITTP